jgi:hypothetical protein
MLQGVVSLVIIWDAEDMSVSGGERWSLCGNEKGGKQAAIYRQNRALFGFGLTHDRKVALK